MNGERSDVSQNRADASTVVDEGCDERRLVAVAATSSFALGARSAGFSALAALTAPNAAVVGLISASGFAPWLLLGPWAGYLVDRTTKARIYQVAGAVSSALCIAAAIWSGLFEVTWVLVLTVSVLLGCLHVVNDTALNTHLGQLVPEQRLAPANGRMSAWQSAMAIVAPALAGAILGRSDVVFFVVLAAAFGGMAYLSAAFRNRGLGRSETPAPGEWKRMEGLRGVWANPGLSALCTSVSLMNLYSGLFAALLPLFILTAVGESVGKVGLAFAIQAGALLAGVVVAAKILATRKNVGRVLLIVSASMKILVFAVMVSSSSFLLVLLACVLNGLSAGLWNAPSSTALIRGSAGPYHSHVIAAYKMIASVGAPLGALLGGAVGAIAGLPMAFAAGLALSTVVAIIVIARRRALEV